MISQLHHILIMAWMVDLILQQIENNQNILLHGPGGVGKSFILRSIASSLSKKGKKVACTAATGIAAINLSVPEVFIAGCTIHSWAGVGLADQPPTRLVARVNHDERSRKRWLDTDLLIIDEISMIGADLLDKLDFVGRSIRRVSQIPFGGIQLVFSGDFLQLPPVKDKWAFQSTSWKELESILTPSILEEPQRYSDVSWFEMLLRFRKGSHTKEDIKVLRARQTAYDEWKKNIAANPRALVIKPTVLNSKRVDVDFENDQELEKLSGPTKDFAAIDEFQPRNSHARAEHYFKQLDDAIPKYIYLKVGAQVMLKANLDIAAGLANGSRGIVVELLEVGVKVKWRDGKTTLVARHVWLQEDKDARAIRNQIPLILAWSSTIHRMQGCTLDYAIANIGPSIFSPGQAYVALSRVKTLEGLLLSEFYPGSIKADEDALEFVERIESTSKIEEPDVSIQDEKSDEDTIYVLNFIDA
jgi:ATP-dependent DNA helicase PIF1